MKKILFVLLINLMFMGVTIGDRMAQAAVCGNEIVEEGEECDDGNTADGDGCSSSCEIEPPDLSVNLRMEFPPLQGAYVLSDLIVPNITVENTGGTTIYVSERAFNEALFQRFTTFIDPDLNVIRHNELVDVTTEIEEPDLVYIDDGTGTGNKIPAEPVRELADTFIVNNRLPDALAKFDGLDRTGRWEAVFKLGVRTFQFEKTFLHTLEETGEEKRFAFSKDVDFKGQFVATAIYHVVDDGDGDGFFYSLASAFLAQMTDPDVDCDDNDFFVNPGVAEIHFNGKDDDCNPATVEFVFEDCCLNGPPRMLTMMYRGFDCSFSNHSQGGFGVGCVDFSPLPGTVYIVALNGPTELFAEEVSLGETFEIDAGVSNTLGFMTVVKIYDVDPGSGGTLHQQVIFRTACHSPLITGDQFGSLQLMGCSE